MGVLFNAKESKIALLAITGEGSVVGCPMFINMYSYLFHRNVFRDSKPIANYNYAKIATVKTTTTVASYF